MGPCLPPKRLGPALPAQLGAQCDSATSEWGQAGGRGRGDPPLPPATPSPPFEASQPPGRPSQRPQWSLGTGLAPGMSGHPRPCGGSVQGLTGGGSGDPGPSRQDGPRRRAVGRRGWGPRSRSWDKRPGLSLLTGAGRGPGPGGRWWLGGRTLCRVRRTVPSQGGPDAPLPGFSGAGSGRRPREKLHMSPANFRRCCPQPRRVETARDSPRPPSPGQRGPRSARGAGEPGVWGSGGGPLTISTWRGSSWLGGAGTENWIFLRSLGSMAGGVVGGAGVRDSGPGRRSRSAGPRCSGDARGEEEEVSALRPKYRGEGDAEEGRRRPDRLPGPPPRSARAPAPRASARGLPAAGPCAPAAPSSPRSFRVAGRLSAAPRCLYLPLSLCVSLCLGLPPSPPTPPSAQPRGPRPSPHLGLAPGGWMGGLRGKWPMSAEKRVLPGPGEGGSVTRPGEQAGGAPCRLPRT